MKATTTCFICAGSLRVEYSRHSAVHGLPEQTGTWPRSLCTTTHKLNRSHTPSAKSSSSRRAFGCACTRRVRCGAQCKHRELAAERCVILQGSIATNGAQAGGGIRQPGGKTDTCPAADAGQDRDVLLAAMLIGRHVSNDAGRC